MPRLINILTWISVALVGASLFFAFIPGAGIEFRISKPAPFVGNWKIESGWFNWGNECHSIGYFPLWMAAIVFAILPVARFRAWRKGESRARGFPVQ